MFLISSFDNAEEEDDEVDVAVVVVVEASSATAAGVGFPSSCTNVTIENKKYKAD